MKNCASLKNENRSWLSDVKNSLAPISEDFEASRPTFLDGTKQALSFC